MNGNFHRVGRHLYSRTYRTATGEQTTLYYARFQCRLKKKPRCLPLGSSLSLAKDALKKLEAKDIDLYDFDIDKQHQVKEKLRDGNVSRLLSLTGATSIGLLMTLSVNGRSVHGFDFDSPSPEAVFREHAFNGNQPGSAATIRGHQNGLDSDPLRQRIEKESSPGNGFK